MPDVLLKTEFEHIRFVKGAKPEKQITDIWICQSKSQNTALGLIKWYPAWRAYCFFPMLETVFSSGCLEDIEDFIAQIMEARK